MTKEEVKKTLESNYMRVYSQFKKLEKENYPVLSEYAYREARKKEIEEIKKEKREPLKKMEFLWPFATAGSELDKMEEEPACYVIELALEKIPEAYMDACRHECFRIKYPEICPEFGIYDLLYGKLSISMYEKTIRDYILDYSKDKLVGAQKKDPQFKRQLEIQANNEARIRWRREREKVLLGPQEEYEENTTWDRFEKYVFPFATRDIWDSLREIYSPDAFVPPEDIDKFNKLYEKYLTTIKGEEKNCPKTLVDEKPSPSVKLKNKSVSAKDIQKIDDPRVFEKHINKKEIKKVSRNDLIYAYYAEKNFIMFSTKEFDSKIISNKIGEIFSKAEEARIFEFIKEMNLTYKDIDEKWQIIKRIFVRNGIVPDIWQRIIKEMLNASLRGNENYLRLWISFIIDCDLYRKLIGDNLTFWTDIPKENVIWLISIIDDVGKHCEDSPIECVYDLFFENKDKDELIKYLWNRMQKEWILKILKSEDISVGANLLRKYRCKYCNDNESLSEFMDYLFVCMHEVVHKKDNISSGEISIDNFMKSSNTVTNSIDSLLDTLDLMGDDAGAEQKNMLTTIKRSVQDIKDKNAYFVETWKGIMDFS